MSVTDEAIATASDHRKKKQVWTALREVNKAESLRFSSCKTNKLAEAMKQQS